MTVSEAHVIDRTGWPSGPWDGEPDKLNWRTQVGLPGMITRNRMGALCGYVAVNPGHPLYGQNYEVPSVHVHGGLTYSNVCAGHICHVPEPGEPDDVFWFGFDCNHSGDLAPSTLALAAKDDRFAVMEWEVYKDIDYVRAEVESLAEQLKAVQ